MKIIKRLAAADKGTSPQTAACLTVLVTTESNTSSMTTLLMLPAELRNRIYYSALAGDDGPEYDMIDVTECDIQKRTDILQTCRQIYHEAKDLFLTSFRFRIKCGHGIAQAAVKWLEGFDARPHRIRAYEITFDSADTLRHRYAFSFRHVCLEILSNRLADHVRAKGYKKHYEMFVNDFLAVRDFLRRHLNLRFHPREISPLDWKLYAPIARLHLRIDEYHYIDMIETVLRDGGWIA